MRTCLLLLCCCWGAAAPLRAAMQQQYVFEVPRGSEEALTADLSLALGRVTVQPATGTDRTRTVFRATASLQDSRLVPDFQHSRHHDEVRVSLDLDADDGFSMRGLRGANQNVWNVSLSDRVALALRLDLGMAEADLNLSGLRLENLELHSGMARTALRFERPNPVPMKNLELNVGMTTFTATGLGNARFETFTFEGGAGSFVLDFTGTALRPGAEAHISTGMSSLQVVLPTDFPVIVHVPDSWMTRVNVPVGYTKRGETVWHSPRVRRAEDALTIYIESGMGSVGLRVGD